MKNCGNIEFKATKESGLVIKIQLTLKKYSGEKDRNIFTTFSLQTLDLHKALPNSNAVVNKIFEKNCVWHTTKRKSRVNFVVWVILNAL